jgi:DNA-binding protein Fis
MKEFNLNQFLADIEMRIIELTLRLHKDNIAQAARYLNIERTTLHARIKQYKIEVAPMPDLKPTKHISARNIYIMKEVARVIQDCNGNRTHAAEIMGMSMRTIRKWCDEAEKVGFEVPKYGRIKK